MQKERYKFYREHKYVCFAVNELERLIAKTDFCDKKAQEHLAAEFTSLVALLKGHADYEENMLHELLRQKGSTVFEHAQSDHEQYDTLLEDLQKRLDSILQADINDDLIEQGYQFYLAFRHFAGQNLLHLHEEETVILPELQKLYSDDELKKVEAATYHIMTPEDLIDMLQVLFPHMNPSDKRAFLSDIESCEPEKFQIVKQAMKL